MEYLIENIDWLLDELQEFAEDAFVLFDCPGQIELYSHLDVMQRLAKAISKTGFMLSAVYCADGTFINEPAKYISACFTALSTMTQLSVPHLNVLTKCDKIKKEDHDDSEETLLDKIVSMGAQECLANVNQFFSPKYFELNKRIVEVIENFNLVQYIPLNI